MLTWDSAEWYTPSMYVEAAREVMGGIDTDPASCEMANKTVQATTYYTKETNGFNKPWNGRVFCNPPYGYDGKCNQAQWAARLVEQYQAGVTTEGILLVNASAGTSWFDTMCEYPVCLPRRRIHFNTPTPRKHSNTHGSALFYLGPQVDKFSQVFGKFGRVLWEVRRVKKPVPTLWNLDATA
jgi:ParB family chromosome partitioning protein